MTTSPKDAKAEDIDPLGHLTLTCAPSYSPMLYLILSSIIVSEVSLEENEFHGFHVPQRVRMIVNLDGTDLVRYLSSIWPSSIDSFPSPLYAGENSSR